MDGHVVLTAGVRGRRCRRRPTCAERIKTGNVMRRRNVERFRLRAGRGGRAQRFLSIHSMPAEVRGARFVAGSRRY